MYKETRSLQESPVHEKPQYVHFIRGKTQRKPTDVQKEVQRFHCGVANCSGKHGGRGPTEREPCWMVFKASFGTKSLFRGSNSYFRTHLHTLLCSRFISRPSLNVKNLKTMTFERIILRGSKVSARLFPRRPAAPPLIPGQCDCQQGPSAENPSMDPFCFRLRVPGSGRNGAMSSTSLAKLGHEALVDAVPGLLAKLALRYVKQKEAAACPMVPPSKPAAGAFLAGMLPSFRPQSRHGKWGCVKVDLEKRTAGKPTVWSRVLGVYTAANKCLGTPHQICRP